MMMLIEDACTDDDAHRRRVRGWWRAIIILFSPYRNLCRFDKISWMPFVDLGTAQIGGLSHIRWHNYYPSIISTCPIFPTDSFLDPQNIQHPAILSNVACNPTPHPLNTACLHGRQIIVLQSPLQKAIGEKRHLIYSMPIMIPAKWPTSRPRH